jgi:type IV secretion system protein TrbL
MTVLANATQNSLPQPSVYFDIMGGALVFMIVGWQVPALAAGMMTGSPSLTLGTAASTAAMMSAAMANAVTKSLSTTASTTRQTTDGLASAVKLTQAATQGITTARQGGAALPAALGRTAGDISRAASQQFRDSVIHGTGRESAAAAEKAAGNQAVQGWGRGTPLGNLTNRVHANRAGVPVAPQPGGAANPPGARPSMNRVTPPAIPHDQAPGNITIRFNPPE